MKHTPGQWRIGKLDSPIYGSNGECIDNGKMIYSRESSYPIGTIGGHRDYKTDANARLISAAPDLLEALQEIHKLWLCPQPKRIKDWAARCDVMADYARKAIAKAEGRE